MTAYESTSTPIPAPTIRFISRAAFVWPIRAIERLVQAVDLGPVRRSLDEVGKSAVSRGMLAAATAPVVGSSETTMITSVRLPGGRAVVGAEQQDGQPAVRAEERTLGPVVGLGVGGGVGVGRRRRGRASA